MSSPSRRPTVGRRRAIAQARTEPRFRRAGMGAPAPPCRPERGLPRQAGRRAACAGCRPTQKTAVLCRATLRDSGEPRRQSRTCRWTIIRRFDRRWPSARAAKLDLDRTDRARADRRAGERGAGASADMSRPGTPVFSLVADTRPLGRGQFQGDRAHPSAPRPAGDDRLSTPIPAAQWAGTVESVAQATGCGLFRSAGPERLRQLGQGRPAHPRPHRHRSEQEDAPALRAGMSVEVSVDTGHKRTFAGLVQGLSDFRRALIR